MENIGKIVIEELPIIFGVVAEGWKVISRGYEDCIIQFPDISISMGYDPKDGTILTELIYNNPEEIFEDKFYLHTLYNIIPYEDIRNISTFNGVREKIKGELLNLKEFLTYIKNNHVNAKDLFYFQCGYNAAYTDCLNSKFK